MAILIANQAGQCWRVQGDLHIYSFGHSSTHMWSWSQTLTLAHYSGVDSQAEARSSGPGFAPQRNSQHNDSPLGRSRASTRARVHQAPREVTGQKRRNQKKRDSERQRKTPSKTGTGGRGRGRTPTKTPAHQLQDVEGWTGRTLGRTRLPPQYPVASQMSLS